MIAASDCRWICRVLAATAVLLAGTHAAYAVPNPGVIVVSVETEAGQPIQGAEVEVIAAHGAGRLPTQRTDARGIAMLSDLAPADYRVAVAAPPHSEWVGDSVLLGSDSGRVVALRSGQVIRLYWRLRRGGDLSVGVTGRGQPVTWACPCDVTIFRGEAEYSGAPAITSDEPPPQTLTFRGLPPASDYTVVFTARGYATQVARSIAIEAGRTATLVFSYDPEDATGVTGTLRMSDGTPVQNAHVYVRRTGTKPVPVPHDGYTRTDDQGHFSIVGLAPGQYSVDLVGRRDAAVVQVESGERADILLTWSETEAVTLSRRPTQAVPATASPPVWPWVKPPNVIKCQQGKVEPTAPLYAEMLPKIVEAFSVGIQCLTAMGKLNRARAMGDLINPDVAQWRKWWSTPQLAFEFDCPQPTDPRFTRACAGAPTIPFVKMAVFFEKARDPGECGCFAAQIFHEVFHMVSEDLRECPPHVCSKLCFACAPDIPEKIQNATGAYEYCVRDCPYCPDLIIHP